MSLEQSILDLTAQFVRLNDHLEGKAGAATPAAAAPAKAAVKTPAKAAAAAPAKAAAATPAKTAAPATAAPAASADGVTKVDMQASLMKLIGKTSKDAAGLIMGLFGSPNISGLDPQYYGAAKAIAEQATDMLEGVEGNLVDIEALTNLINEAKTTLDALS